MHFCLIYSNNHPLHVSIKATIHHQQAVTVCAAFGTYRASALTTTQSKRLVLVFITKVHHDARSTGCKICRQTSIYTVRAMVEAPGPFPGQFTWDLW
jgi:hypothetical protein